jgi:glutathione peroxidase
MKQYTQLVQLIDQYEGFRVLAFPCNQFLKQEPGSASEIQSFVEKITNGGRERLVLFEKRDVNGANARPVFTYLKTQLPFSDGTTNVLWNFGKFIVDHNGIPMKRFGSQTDPMAMKEIIEELLKERNSDE